MGVKGYGLTSFFFQLDARRAPCDTLSAPPTVTNIGPQLFHRSHPSHPPTSHPHPAQVSLYTLSYCLSYLQIIFMYIQEVSEKQAPPTTTPLEPTSMSPELSNTLQHIVGQLDILTQVEQQPRNKPHMVHMQGYHCSLS